MKGMASTKRRPVSAAENTTGQCPNCCGGENWSGEYAIVENCCVNAERLFHTCANALWCCCYHHTTLDWLQWTSCAIHVILGGHIIPMVMCAQSDWSSAVAWGAMEWGPGSSSGAIGMISGTNRSGKSWEGRWGDSDWGLCRGNWMGLSNGNRLVTACFFVAFFQAEGFLPCPCPWGIP